jgi:uncharacterized membrane protein
LILSLDMQGQAIQADNEARAYLSRAPGDRRAHSLLAFRLDHHGRLKAAIAVLRTAVQQFPQNKFLSDDLAALVQKENAAYHLTLRNECSRNVFVAVMYLDSDRKWLVKGWWTVGPSVEVTVAQSSNNRAN